MSKVTDTPGAVPGGSHQYGFSSHGQTKLRMKLWEYLFQRLHDAGCRQAFGVPGDFNLGLLNCLIKSPIDYIGCCNELNAAYAADGCARVCGLAACVTTYAVGELSALNGIAGAYAESVPVVKITGAPARRYYASRQLLHHTLGDYRVPNEAYKLITIDQCLVDDPVSAARNIDRCIKSCIRGKQPVYIAIPSDMVEQELEFHCSEALDGTGPDDELLVWNGVEAPKSDPSALEEAVQEIIDRIANAKRPVLIPGVDLIRRNYRAKFAELTEKTNIPYTTMLLAKGILNEDHPNFVGLYQGLRSRPEVRELVEESDCVIIFGEKLTDFNTGGFSQSFTNENRIMVHFDRTCIKSHQYIHIYLPDVLDKLIERVPAHKNHWYDYKSGKLSCVIRPSSGEGLDKDEPLTMKHAFKSLVNYLEEDMVLIAETGSSMFATAETLLPRGTTYIGQTFYGAIGYTVGACFGACMALQKEGKNRKCMLIVGDGSLQLTVQEISSMIRHKCNPTILIINNDGYLIERVITDNTYNDIQMWDYAGIPKIFGGKPGFKVSTLREFENAMEHAKTHRDELTLIEGIFGKWDCNILLKSAGRAMALHNGLTPSITTEMLTE